MTMKAYKHGIAAYPKGFRGCVVSENKICLQFEAPSAKVRVDDHKRDELIKLPNGQRGLAITEEPTEIGFVALGCKFHVLEDMLRGFLNAIDEHRLVHGKEQTKDLVNILRRYVDAEAD